MKSTSQAANKQINSGYALPDDDDDEDYQTDQIGQTS